MSDATHLGDYEVLELLGEGGMGQVFKASHAHQIVHRDLKPSNVRVRPGDQDAVIEHLSPADQERATRALCDSVRPNGLLIFIVDLTGDCEEFPMHTAVDIRRLHRIVADRSFHCIQGKHRFCSVWVRS